ncbi:MAG: MGMT family protein [Lachnospiraceae bacterium]|nr:MGMT family protein [Lachnospiraceae bacterium]
MGFHSDVYAMVRQIPAGKVATYGQIARLIGRPGAARAVGNALHANPDGSGTPCYKVVNSQGELSGAYAFGGLREQRYLLEQDGVEVVNFRVDLGRFQWDGP